MPDLIKVEGVYKHYGEHDVQALSDINLNVPAGEFVAVMGPSGCGKSSLLNILGAIDTATSGKVIFDGEDLCQLGDRELTVIRREKIGFVFQFFNLLNTMKVWENVSLPLALSGRLNDREIRTRVAEYLDKVGLAQRSDFFPSQLSGGEMQRVAIARALVHQPKLIIADEPTGNLDSETGQSILELFAQMVASGGHTVVMATHSLEVARYAHKVVYMRDGKLESIACSKQNSTQASL